MEKKGRGRPKAIESPERMWELFCQYRKWEKEENIVYVHDFVGKDGRPDKRERESPLTMEGFDNWLFENGVCYDAHHYFSNHNNMYEEFLPICTRIRAIIRQDQIRGGMTGIYNTSITQRLNGLVEKSEQKIIKEQPLFGDDKEDE